MPLPLQLLRAGMRQPMMIELKNGETYNGHLTGCDDRMNVHLEGVTCTSSDGERFWKMDECVIRGSTLKNIRLPEVVATLCEEQAAKIAKKPKNRGAKRRARDESRKDKRPK